LFKRVTQQVGRQQPAVSVSCQRNRGGALRISPRERPPQGKAPADRTDIAFADVHKLSPSFQRTAFAPLAEQQTAEAAHEKTQ
jgi:hypothetical protein